MDDHDDEAVEGSREAYAKMFAPRDAVEEFCDAASDLTCEDYDDDDDDDDEARAAAEIALAGLAETAVEELIDEFREFADQMESRHNDMEQAMPANGQLTPEARERFDKIRSRLFDLAVMIGAAQ